MTSRLEAAAGTTAPPTEAPRRRTGLAVVAVVAALAPALVLGYRGLAGGAGGPAPLPPDPPVVTVAMSEYRFEFGAIPGGRVVFDVENEGRTRHSLSLVPLPDDFPPILDQLRGRERRYVETLAAVAALAPGQRRSVAVDLTTGRYAFICFVTERDGTSHAQEGQATEFRVA